MYLSPFAYPDNQKTPGGYQFGAGFICVVAEARSSAGNDSGNRAVAIDSN